MTIADRIKKLADQCAKQIHDAEFRDPNGPNTEIAAWVHGIQILADKAAKKFDGKIAVNPDDLREVLERLDAAYPVRGPAVNNLRNLLGLNKGSVSV